MSQAIRTLRNVSLSIMVIAGLWMALELGIGEALGVVLSPADAAPETVAAFQGNIDFTDRLVTATVFLSILGPVGFGFFRNSGSYPFINQAIRYTPIIAGLVGLTALGSEAADVINGDWVWANYADAYSAMVVFVTAAIAASVGTLLQMNER